MVIVVADLVIRVLSSRINEIKITATVENASDPSLTQTVLNSIAQLFIPSNARIVTEISFVQRHLNSIVNPQGIANAVIMTDHLLVVMLSSSMTPPFIPSLAPIVTGNFRVPMHYRIIRSPRNIAIALSAIDSSSTQKLFASICGLPFTQRISIAVIANATL